VTEAEILPSSWSPPGCNYPITTGRLCGKEAATVDGICGKRCEDHAPTFDPQTAVELMRRGLPGAALSYLRNAS